MNDNMIQKRGHVLRYIPGYLLMISLEEMLLSKYREQDNKKNSDRKLQVFMLERTFSQNQVNVCS